MIDLLTHCHFLRPLWFLMLIPIACIAIVIIKNKQHTSTHWAHLCDPVLRPFMLNNPVKKTTSHLLIWLLITWVMATLCLAGPTWSYKPIPVYESPLSRVMVLNLSSSMNVTDLQPSRIMRTRYKLLDLLRASPDIRTALVVFAEKAYVVSPLTHDVSTIENIVPILSPDLMPTSANNPAAGLSLGLKLIDRAHANQHASIWLFTDSAGGDDAIKQARALHTQGITLNVIGVGTTRGGPIPLKDGNFITDATGKIVRAHLDSTALARLAAAGGGYYRPMSQTDADINALLAATTPTNHLAREKTNHHLGKFWSDKGPLFLLLLLPLVLIAYRRGALGLFTSVLLPVTMMSTPHDAHAMGLWQTLWSNKNQQGLFYLKHQDPKKALDLFTDPTWQAVASYKAQDYGQALTLFQKTKDATSLYNSGNALAKQGQFKAAIEQYKHALKKDPHNKDATFNIALLEKHLQQQQKQKKQSSKSTHKQQKNNDHPPKKKQSSSNKTNPQHAGRSTSPQSEKPKQPPSPGDRKKASTSPHQEQKSKNSAHGSTHSNTSHTQKAPKASPSPPTRSKSHKADENATPLTHKKKQAINTWLKQIPDDPGGLLRQEFAKEYSRLN